MTESGGHAFGRVKRKHHDTRVGLKGYKDSRLVKGIRICDRSSRCSGVQECSCREDCDEDTTVADSKRTLVVSRVSHQFAKTCRTLKDRGCNVGGRCIAPHTGGRAQHGSGVTIAISAWA